MFKKILFSCLILLNLGVELAAQSIPSKPNPPRLVNDFVGGLLSDSQIQALESKLVAYNDSSSSQILVVIVKSVQPYAIEDYALKIGREWGVGQAGKNNGIVLLWAPGDRKVTIQTGYGLEGALPDMYASQIIRNIISPNFKSLQYYQGLDQATTAIINYAKGEYQAEPEEATDDILILFLVFLGVILLFIFLSRNNRNKGGGNDSRHYDGGFPYDTYSGWGRRSGHYGGGGFGSGGGFGGFGGGSFGGGGASGDY